MVGLQAGAGVLRLTGDPHPLDTLAARGETLAARAAEALRSAIVDGRLAAGGRFSVTQLADQLGVSRTPVREALLMLERQGLVRFERNRGVRVLETSAHDLQEIFSLRLLLEVPATRRACGLLGAGELRALGRELEAMRALAPRGDEGAFMARDERFHEIVLAASGNRRLVEIVRQLRGLVRFRGASTVGRSHDLAAIVAEHESIDAALRARDAEAAGSAMREHLLTTGRLLLAQDAAPVDGLEWIPR